MVLPKIFYMRPAAIPRDLHSLPKPLAELRFPDLPEGLTWQDLGVESRARRCLEGTVSPQRLSTVTVGELLNLPGFGRRSFGSLLARVKECWTDQARVHATPNEVPTLTVLRSELELAAALGRVLPEIETKYLPTPPPGTQFRELKLKYTRARFLSQMVRTTEADLRDEISRANLRELASRGASAAVLFDLMCGIEAAGGREWGNPDTFSNAEVRAAAHRLRENRSSARVYADDPRFGALIRFLATEAQDAQQVACIVIAVAEARASLPSRLRQVVRLEHAIQNADSLGLVEELAMIAAAVTGERDRAILQYRLGWDGGGTHPLSEVAARFRMSGERIRQICKAAEDRLRTREPFAPALDRLLRQMTQQASMRPGVMGDFGITGIESAARVLGRAAAQLRAE